MESEMQPWTGPAIMYDVKNEELWKLLEETDAKTSACSYTAFHIRSDGRTTYSSLPLMALKSSCLKSVPT